MDKNAEWNEFLGKLLSSAIKTHDEAKEREYQRQRQEQINEIIETHFNELQRSAIYDILVDIQIMYELENEVAYHQGLNDCAWMLKNLGVLA